MFIRLKLTLREHEKIANCNVVDEIIRCSDMIDPDWIVVGATTGTNGRRFLHGFELEPVRPVLVVPA